MTNKNQNRNSFWYPPFLINYYVSVANSLLIYDAIISYRRELCILLFHDHGLQSEHLVKKTIFTFVYIASNASYYSAICLSSPARTYVIFEYFSTLCLKLRICYKNCCQYTSKVIYQVVCKMSRHICTPSIFWCYSYNK